MPTLEKVVDELGQRWSPPKEATLLKQYELVRSEVTTSLQIQQQILAFGIATIGLLAGAAFVGKSEQLRSQLLVVFLPLIAYLAITIWFSEVMRMLRAGAFLMTIEKKLDQEGDGALVWESRVASARLRYAGRPAFTVRDPDRLRLLAVTLLFLTLAVASIMLGWDAASWYARAFALTVGGLTAFLLPCLSHLHLHQLRDVLGAEREPWPRRLRHAVERTLGLGETIRTDIAARLAGFGPHQRSSAMRAAARSAPSRSTGR
jgi:hypothetical protein